MAHEHRHGQNRAGDVRGRGFADRVSVEHATAWIDAHAVRLAAEEIDIAEAAGRVLAATVKARQDLPLGDRAGIDGYALRASETIGASDYNPILLTRQDAPSLLRPGAAAIITSGSLLPPGANAIVPFERVQENEAAIEIFGAVPEGTGLERQGQRALAGAVVFEAGHELRTHDVALLALLGIVRVAVVARPQIQLIVAGSKTSAAGTCGDANGPMLRRLIVRDGGVVCSMALGISGWAALVEKMAESPPNAILVVGRTGTCPDDDAPSALAEIGGLAIHGVALRPGGSSGMGLIQSVPVILLPGDPLACLCSYELFAGRLIRRLGGRDPDFPHPTREVEVGRKLVSEVGLTEFSPVRLIDGRAEPLGAPEFGGLAAAARADGFVLIPPSHEGYAIGSRISVRVYT